MYIGAILQIAYSKHYRSVPARRGYLRIAEQHSDPDRMLLRRWTDIEL